MLVYEQPIEFAVLEALGPRGKLIANTLMQCVDCLLFAGIVANRALAHVLVGQGMQSQCLLASRTGRLFSQSFPRWLRGGQGCYGGLLCD